MADGPANAPVMTELERLRIEAGNAAAWLTMAMVQRSRAEKAEARAAELEQLLNATAVNRDQGAGVPSGAAVAPTGPGGGPGPPPGPPVALVHYGTLPFVALCGADRENQWTAARSETVTCSDCQRLLQAALTLPAGGQTWRGG